jgi:hypothetical protein
MLPGDFLQVSTSQSSVAQGIDDNSKGAGPGDRSRVSPALGATLVAQYMCVCVCVCVCARARVHACVLMELLTK